MSGRAHRRLTGLLLLWLLPLPWAYAGPDSVSGTAAVPALTIEGLAARPGEDNPRMLFILPWQAPTLPRHPEASLPEQAPELEAEGAHSEGIREDYILYTIYKKIYKN